MIKPILFNTEMTRAILDGRKTVTRRAIKQNLRDGVVFEGICVNGDKDIGGKAIFRTPQFMSFIKPPYQPDDVLWVRETWGIEECEKCRSGISYLGGECKCEYVYKAGCNRKFRWHPSIHMPKEAARIFLRVTDVRAERVQEITDGQAVKEGFTGVPCNHPNWHGMCEDCMNSGYLEPPTVEFVDLWNSTVKDLDRYGWNANPWVWVIEFERCEKPEGWPA